MLQKILILGVVLTLVGLSGCSKLQPETDMSGKVPVASQPPTKPFTLKQAQELVQKARVPYLEVKYPGLGKNFKPHVHVTPTQTWYVYQLDWSCTYQINNRLRGGARTMLTQASVYGVLEGIFNAAGAVAGYGDLIKPLEYLKQGGVFGFGAGLGSGYVTAIEARHIAHGYCMTLMVSMAKQIDGKLHGIGMVPLPAGDAKLLPVEPPKSFGRVPVPEKYKGGAESPPPMTQY